MIEKVTLITSILNCTLYYHRYHEAILDTIVWRDKFGIDSIDTSKFAHLVRNGMGYTRGLDKFGRSIIYLKIGRNYQKETAEVYLNHMMYTVER